jgi:AcrR family transcriptional regulator
MTEQLSAKDWLDQGLKTLASDGFTALKAEPLAKAMGVSRGSFYWHFADIGAFHAAILKHWREIAAEQIIANLEAHKSKDNPLELLLRQAFGGRLVLEKAVRTWATLDPVARSAVQAIDRRRLGYVEKLLGASGLPADVARPRAQILYWAFLGFALSDRPLPQARQAEVIDELLRIASR